MVLGIRGMPNVQGGVETHAEHLYQRLAALGCDVEVIVRTPFVDRSVRSLGPIRLRRVWAPRKSGLEALIHSLLGVLYAGLRRPDLLHIHAIGPAIVVPIARLLGLKVIVTHHGPDYDRDKWGGFARLILRLGERYGMTCSHARIVISKVIQDLVRSKYAEESDLIPNGVIPASLSAEAGALVPFGLESGKYFVQVGRIVPEKRQLDLISAFTAASVPGWKLAIVGGLDSSGYCKSVQQAAEAAGVVMTGFQTGKALQQFYSNAGVFVLPSSHEGLPIAMLEALSYGLPVIASDIPANLEVGLPASSYFALGDKSALAARLTDFAGQDHPAEARDVRRAAVAAKYNWDDIARATLDVYRRITR